MFCITVPGTSPMKNAGHQPNEKLLNQKFSYGVYKEKLEGLLK